MAHQCNLVMQTLFDLLTIVRFENLIYSLYSYFAKSSKKHMEFTKLIDIWKQRETCSYTM
jgi:hypothetical protein